MSPDHLDQIRALELGAARTEVHLQNIDQTLGKLDAKLDALGAKVEDLRVALALKPAHRPGNWRERVILVAVGAAIAWGPKALGAIGAALIGK